MRYRFIALCTVLSILIVYWTYSFEKEEARRHQIILELTDLPVYVFSQDSLQTSLVASALRKFGTVQGIMIESGYAVAESLATMEGIALLPNYRDHFELPDVITFRFNAKELSNTHSPGVFDTLYQYVSKQDIDFPHEIWNAKKIFLKEIRKDNLISRIGMAIMLFLITVLLRFGFELGIILSRCRPELSIVDKWRDRNRILLYSFYLWFIPLGLANLIYYTLLGRWSAFDNRLVELLVWQSGTLLMSVAITYPIILHYKKKYYIIASPIQVFTGPEQSDMNTRLKDINSQKQSASEVVFSQRRGADWFSALENDPAKAFKKFQTEGNGGLESSGMRGNDAFEGNDKEDT